MNLISVDSDEIIAKLDEMYPGWIINLASPSILKDWIRYKQEPKDVKVRLLMELWPICQATYAALHKKNANV